MDNQQKDLSLINRIYLVRQLLYEALQLMGDNFPVSRMRIFLSLDHAIEILLSTLLSELNVTVDRSWGLPKMLEELISQKPKLGSHRTPIERLRRLRDRVQHDGIVPSPEDVRQASLEAEAFIRGAVREVLDQELEEFSPIMLIADEKAREHLKKAEQALQQGDYSAATKEAAAGFAIGWRNFTPRLSNRFPYLFSEKLLRELSHIIGKAMKGAAEKVKVDTFKHFADSFESKLHSSKPSYELDALLKELIEPIEMAQYGIDMHGYHRFQQITPPVSWFWGSEEPKVHTLPNWSPSQQDALFAFDFAITSLLRLQHWVAR